MSEFAFYQANDPRCESRAIESSKRCEEGFILQREVFIGHLVGSLPFHNFLSGEKERLFTMRPKEVTACALAKSFRSVNHARITPQS
jgi:hypothetical protein